MENTIVTDLFESFFRWFHVFFGILWIGLLYFFNFVNGPFAATMDGDTKKKVVPELMPRALFWFRYGALFTWLTGVILLGMVFYQTGYLFEVGQSWGAGAGIMILATFAAVFVYDALATSAKNPLVLGAVGFVLIAVMTLLFKVFGGFSYRGFVIHTGALFGSIMAFNVWYRIWPNQQKIITAVKNGQAPDAALVATAGLRSRHNTFLSVPLVWTMINSHTTFLAGAWWSIPVVVALGWMVVKQLYSRAGKVKGF